MGFICGNGEHLCVAREAHMNEAAYLSLSTSHCNIHEAAGVRYSLLRTALRGLLLPLKGEQYQYWSWWAVLEYKIGSRVYRSGREAGVHTPEAQRAKLVSIQMFLRIWGIRNTYLGGLRLDFTRTINRISTCSYGQVRQSGSLVRWATLISRVHGTASSASTDACTWLPIAICIMFEFFSTTSS